MKDNIPIEKQIQKLTAELEVFQTEVNALEVKLEAASDESEYKNIRLSFDYNKLQVEKLQKKIEKLENEKIEIETQLKDLERQISVLNCVLDFYQLQKEAKNFEDRKARAVERVLKAIKDREGLIAMRENLNKQWTALIGEDKELCERLPLKASAEIYFI
ncbi:MAG TPA: hypothetical protein VMW78_03770 [Anaerolineae bacterium]|nr:hypothetical protein [Anaerolineae bacterium]